MKAGADKTDITPPIGLPILKLVSDTINAVDNEFPLFCRTLVIQDNYGNYSSISECDLSLLDRKFTDRALAAASEKTGIPVNNMMICCSNTHFCPQVSEVFTSPIPYNITNYFENLVEMITESIVKAYDQLDEAFVGFGVEKDIALLHLINFKGNTIGLIYNCICNDCNVLSNKSSDDYPGVTSAILEEKLSGTALFLSGICGNIHPINEEIDDKKSVFSNPHSKGKKNVKKKNNPTLQDKIISLAKSIVRYEESDIKSVKQEIQIPIRDVSHISKDKTSFNTIIQITNIGDYAIVGVPAEAFVEFALEISEKSPFKYTFVCEMPNDCVEYTQNDKAFELGDFQTWANQICKLAPKTGNMIVQAVGKILSAL